MAKDKDTSSEKDLQKFKDLVKDVEASGEVTEKDAKEIKALREKVLNHAPHNQKHRQSELSPPGIEGSSHPDLIHTDPKKAKSIGGHGGNKATGDLDKDNPIKKKYALAALPLLFIPFVGLPLFLAATAGVLGARSYKGAKKYNEIVSKNNPYMTEEWLKEDFEKRKIPELSKEEFEGLKHDLIFGDKNLREDLAEGGDLDDLKPKEKKALIKENRQKRLDQVVNFADGLGIISSETHKSDISTLRAIHKVEDGIQISGAENIANENIGLENVDDFIVLFQKKPLSKGFSTHTIKDSNLPRQSISVKTLDHLARAVNAFRDCQKIGRDAANNKDFTKAIGKVARKKLDNIQMPNSEIVDKIYEYKNLSQSASYYREQESYFEDRGKREQMRAKANEDEKKANKIKKQFGNFDLDDLCLQISKSELSVERAFNGSIEPYKQRFDFWQGRCKNNKQQQAEIEQELSKVSQEESVMGAKGRNKNHPRPPLQQGHEEKDAQQQLLLQQKSNANNGRG